MKTLNRKSIEVSQAQAKIMSHINPLEIETVPLINSIGRRLAEEIYATCSIPYFIKSGMDGFAVRAEDIKGASKENPVLLEVNQIIPCGIVPSLPIKPGQAARIMTGAPLPLGADTVVMFEMTENVFKGRKTFVAIKKEVAKGRNVSSIGSEIKENEFLLEKGRKISAGEIALLATFGFSQVKVFRKPRVAIITTGSELISVDDCMKIGKIRDSNQYMLYSQVAESGCEIVAVKAIPDSVTKIKELLNQIITEVDVVITSGGVSVGDYDIIAELFTEWEEKLLFNKIKMRPGSVTTAGILDDKFLFGLSGNPGACFVGFELFVRPTLYGLQGKKNVFPAPFNAYLQHDYLKKDIFPRYVRGRSFVQDGKIYVDQVGTDQSSVILSIKDSDCLIMIPPSEGVLAGELVSVLKLHQTDQ